MQKLIEKALPLRVLSESAVNDTVKAGHPGNIHPWWNRSPISSSAALLYASLVEQDGCTVHDIAEGKITENILPEENLPTVVDCFSGFGGLTNAAQLLGMKTVSSDLNSVAVLITKVIAEIPEQFDCLSAIHPEAQMGVKSGSKALAEDVAYYGELLQKKAEQKLKAHYESKDGINPLSFFWTRTVQCSNPLCKCETPLASSFILNKGEGREYWAEPVLSRKKLGFMVHQGKCPEGKESNKLTAKGAIFKCPFCGETITEEYVKSEGNNGRIGKSLMAVCIEKDGTKSFLSKDEFKVKSEKIKQNIDLPHGPISNISRWFSPPLYGYKDYVDIYTDRQLLMLSTFCDLIFELQSKIASDAFAAGMNPEGGRLYTGGKGALAYGEAIGVYLSLVISKMACYHTSMCSLDNRTGTGRATFSRQAIAMTWTFVENNPFSNATGNFNTTLKNIVASIENLPETNPATVTQADALSREYPDNMILFTELPYYDNIGYADLSDFFYIWLRKCLKETYPGLFERIVSSKEEISSIPEHYDNNSEKAESEYEKNVSLFVEKIKDKISDEYPSTLFFGVNKQDLSSISGKTDIAKNTHFEHLAEVLLKSGLEIKATWPVRTEKSTEKFDLIRTAVVIKKSKGKTLQTTRRGFIADLRKKLPDLLDHVINSNTDEEDYMISSLGLGLSVLTSYLKVINADGSNLSAKDALQLIYQEADSYFASLRNIKED